MRSMLLAAAALVVAFGVTTQATELDKETTVTTEQVQLAQELPATVIVRVKAGDEQNVEVLHSKTFIEGDDATKAKIASAQFLKMDVKGQMKGELDQGSSSSSWYFCFPSYNYYSPSYYYSGYQYSYSSYYSYYSSGYYYSYYRWSYASGYGYGY